MNLTVLKVDLYMGYVVINVCFYVLGSLTKLKGVSILIWELEILFPKNRFFDCPYFLCNFPLYHLQ